PAELRGRLPLKKTVSGDLHGTTNSAGTSNDINGSIESRLEKASHFSDVDEECDTDDEYDTFDEGSCEDNGESDTVPSKAISIDRDHDQDQGHYRDQHGAHPGDHASHRKLGISNA
ncbi:hypothetical protein, partial [Crenalkalicoccus roseus]|uniref:hypothetical protein n=1 Tax=Crenalkalicoccus roseus TaxID=1485588 RepID=UPI001958C229